MNPASGYQPSRSLAVKSPFSVRSSSVPRDLLLMFLSAMLGMGLLWFGYAFKATGSDSRQQLQLWDLAPSNLTYMSTDLQQCNHMYNALHYFLPTVHCGSKRRVGRCKDGAKWLCGVHQLAAQQQCVVYSFGSNYNTCFEDALVELAPGCEVHVFDPTVDEAKISKLQAMKSGAGARPSGAAGGSILSSPGKWFFHTWGISGEDPTDTSYWTPKGKRATCAGCVLKTLGQTMQQLGHSHVDVLKIDVDGAEWRAFQQMIKSGDIARVSQVQVELTGIDITPSTAHVVAQFFRSMAERGFRVFHLETNVGTCKRGPEQAPSVEYAMLNTLTLPQY